MSTQAFLDARPAHPFSFRMWVSGPRWAKFQTFLENECWIRRINIVSIETETGIIRETIRFEVEGEYSAVEDLVVLIERVIQKHGSSASHQCESKQ